MVEEVARLAAIEDIRQLKARYFRAIDSRDWDLFESLFTADAVLDVSNTGSVRLAAGSGLHEGAAAIRATCMAALAGATTVHHGHSAEIEIISKKRARAIWAFEDIIVRPEGDGQRKIQGYGHYREDYEKVAGAWRIARSAITRLYLESTLKVP